MHSLVPGLSSKYKHDLDFSLIPFGVVLIEFSAFATELSKSDYENVSNLVLMRTIHTAMMLLLSWFLSRIYSHFNLKVLSYRTIALTGTIVIAVGEFFHWLLLDPFQIDPVSIYRRIGIVFLQGFFWFPAFMIVGCKRTAIFDHFKSYEQRLISASRARNRNSDEFKEFQVDFQSGIRKDLNDISTELKNELIKIDNSDSDLTLRNSEIQKVLKGDSLRQLSMKLDNFGSDQSDKTIFGQSMPSFRFLVTQFKILYESTVRVAPLKANTYAIILIVLIAPGYINYFTFSESILSFPILALAIIAASRTIEKSSRIHSKAAFRKTSLLIFATGYLPLIANVIGQRITHNSETEIPLFVLAVSLPCGYYFFMKVLQVLQPAALDLIRGDFVKASSELESAIAEIVDNEFRHTLAHRWAVYIHGKILTRLAAASLKLEIATNSNDHHTFESGVDSLLELLEFPDRDFDQKSVNLETEVQSRLIPWSGLLEVSLEIDSDLKSIRSSRVLELGEVIEEILSNSMRHGKAQYLRLKVSRKGDVDILVSAIDDAILPPPEFQSRYGLGTRIFNLASDGRWSISRIESGTEFSLEMRIDSQL